MIPINIPITKNAPAGNRKNSAGGNPKESPKIFPFPNTSLIEEIRIRAQVNPIPIAKASIIESFKEFLEANASALPNIMQFTVIRGTNIPKLLSSNGKKAFSRSSTMVTKEAIITIKQGSLISRGITFLKQEIIELEPKRTKVTANPIPKALETEVVIANTGHKPIISTKIGFSLKMPLLR